MLMLRLCFDGYDDCKGMWPGLNRNSRNATVTRKISNTVVNSFDSDELT